MNEKRNEKDYENLAGLLRTKVANFWVKIWATEDGIFVYPSDEKKWIDPAMIISSTVIISIYQFCLQHKLDFYISTSVIHESAYFLIY